VGEASRHGGQRRSEITAAAVGIGVVGWHCGAATQRAVVDCRALCMHWATFSAITFVRPCLLRMGQTGWWGVGAPNLSYPVSRSQSRTPVNDTRPWKLYMPPDILVRRQCVDVMYVCHSIHPTDRNNAERTLVRPLTLKPTLHLYDLLWTCWCAVFDLAFV